jgi:hypothetical protein
MGCKGRGRRRMNGFTKILFWMLTIGLGFVNPLISVAMVVLYYLPGIIQDICKPCSESQEDYNMNSFSEDVAEEMK